MASGLPKLLSGNESRARKEIMMRWVLQTFAIDPYWNVTKKATRCWKCLSKNFHVVEKTCEALAVDGLKR